jgi:hypothetical protein
MGSGLAFQHAPDSCHSSQSLNLEFSYPQKLDPSTLGKNELLPTTISEGKTRAEGGSKSLYNPDAEGVKFIAMYGAFPEHIIYYLVEAEKIEAVEAFLLPGFKRCTSKVTPVSQVPIVK